MDIKFITNTARAGFEAVLYLQSQMQFMPPWQDPLCRGGSWCHPRGCPAQVVFRCAQRTVYGPPAFRQLEGFVALNHNLTSTG